MSDQARKSSPSLGSETSRPHDGIAARVYISAHTVQYHPRTVYAKLEIRARSQLNCALRAD